MNTAKSRPTAPAIARGKDYGSSASQTDRPGKQNASSETPAGGANPATLDLLSEFARKGELAQQFGVSERTIERWVRLQILPPPVRLGRTSLHHVPTIQKHLAKKLQPEPARRRRS